MNLKEILKNSKYFLNKNQDEIKEDEINILQDLIQIHSDLYYNKDKPIVSDIEYDELFKLLKNLENKFGIEIKISELVGSSVKESTFEKVKHSRLMISLDNTYNEDDLKDFNERVIKNIEVDYFSIGESKYEADDKEDNIKYTIEFKFDGLGVELIYKWGMLVQAITRGNGVEGEDVTQNVMQIKNIPKRIDYKDDLEIRGEVVMPISSFEELNDKAKKQGGKIFSNPRNAASGSLRLLDNSVTKERKLKFFAYDLANFEEFRIKENINNYYDVIKDLEKMGFDISVYFKKCNGIKKVIKKIHDFGDFKKEIDFEIDGLVIKVNDISLWNVIGSTEHHPRYAIAYKFPAEILTTKIIGVEHSIGRTGTITPVAHLEPIIIGGAVISRATLHNYEEVEKLDIKIGDSIFIKRAGEVIPKVISVIKDVRNGEEKLISVPEFCPSCSSEIKKDEDKVRYYCDNNYCFEKVAGRLTFAVGKQGFNIDGFGERQVRIFLEKGIISTLDSIFEIEKNKEKILEMEGFQSKSVNNLIKSVNNSKKIKLATLITSLGISGVGKKTARVLSPILGNVIKGKVNISELTLEELENLGDVGPEIASNVISYLEDIDNKEQLKDLVDLLDIEFPEKKENKGIFSDKTMCITGSFESYKRDDLIEILEKNGGEFISSVSKKLDFLLAGEKAGGKLKKAKDLGINVLSVEEFLAML